jgi:hypothetical protein
VTDNPATRDATLLELLDAMAHYHDDDVFRWFQVSRVGTDGITYPIETLRLTFGQVRREIGWRKSSS